MKVISTNVPLNQSYRIEETLEARPEVRNTKNTYADWARAIGREPYLLHPSLGKPGKVHVGRAYDAALTLSSLEFDGLDVLELGARDSWISPYLTRVARRVEVTDIFGKVHLGSGSLSYWEEWWKKAAFNPERLTAETVDMMATGYEADTFDVVICISAIEHVNHPADGDIISSREMGRIVKPGGFLAIGTDLSDEFRRAGGYYYDEAAVHERLIQPSGCSPHGPIDLSWENADKSPHKSGKFEKSCCFFVLRKPGG